MIDEKIAVGVVGLGKMGIAHMAILNAIDGTSIRAVAEQKYIIKRSVRTVMPSVHVYDDHEKMLSSEKLDAVYITAPTAAHVRIAEACLARGIDFFVEKPLGLRAADCVDLVAGASRPNVITMVGYCKHFVDTFAKAKELLSSGILGEPIYFTSSMYVSQLFSTGTGWRYKKESSGGGALNILGTHLVDLLLWFFGDVARVTGAVKSHYSSEVEDFAHAYLWFKRGLEGSLDVSWSVRNYRLPEIKIEVQCDGGVMSVSEDYLRYSLDSGGESIVLYKQDLFRGVPVYVGGAEYTLEDQHFIECVRSRRKSDLDVGYGHAVQLVTDAIYLSANKRRAVDICGTGTDVGRD